MGARFDIAWQQLRSGQLWAPRTTEEVEAARDAFDAAKESAKAITSSVAAHGEL